MITCDFCLKTHDPDVVLVESFLKTAHICEFCLALAAKLVEEQRKK